MNLDKMKVFEQDKKYFMPVFSRYPLVLSHGEGPYIFDTDGKKYIDFLAGIAVNVLGHARPELVKAICEQAGRLIHCSNLYYTEPQVLLIEKLAELSGLNKVFIANSGAEANEGAMKLARKFGKMKSADKFEIVTAEHSFHGRTLATLTATGQPKYQEGYEPLPGGFRYVPFNDKEALEAVVSAKTCAVLIEPIQGEGGVHVPLDGYLQYARELCDKHGAVLIFDEIQSGMGRTGTFLACQGYGVKPDIVTLAKGLAGGVPIGAFMATDEVAAAFSPGDHGSTFGGNPLACAAALAVLNVIEKENLMANASSMGTYLMNELENLKKKYPALIKIVRGKGLMVGAELSKPGREVVDRCMTQGAIINCTAGNVLRFVPPLDIRREHVDEVIAILDGVLEKWQ
jgi:acetylornithine/N-succinyldiaminopimelate aminotransferase